MIGLTLCVLAIALNLWSEHRVRKARIEAARAEETLAWIASLRDEESS